MSKEDSIGFAAAAAAAATATTVTASGTTGALSVTDAARRFNSAEFEQILDKEWKEAMRNYRDQGLAERGRPKLIDSSGSLDPSVHPDTAIKQTRNVWSNPVPKSVKDKATTAAAPKSIDVVTELYKQVMSTANGRTET